MLINTIIKFFLHIPQLLIKWNLAFKTQVQVPTPPTVGHWANLPDFSVFTSLLWSMEHSSRPSPLYTFPLTFRYKVSPDSFCCMSI